MQHINQQAQTALNLAIQNAEAQAQTGTAPTDQPIGKESFLAAYKDPVAAEAHYARYASARETATAIASMQTQSTAQLVELLDGKKAQKLNGAITDPSDPAFAIKEHNRQIAERAAATIIRQRQADPWAYAIQNRDFAAQIIDPTSADFGKQLQARSAALPGMMQKYGTGPVLLSDAETKALTNRFAELPADQRVGMLKQIRTSIGDDGAYLQLLNSIRKDSPVTAMVGNIAAIGGTMRVGDADMPLDDVARRIAIGEDLLNKTKKDKGEDGNKGNFQMPKEAQMRQYWVDHVGKAYAGYPDAEAHAYEAFRAYYAARQAEKGVNDPKAGIDDKVAKEAMTAGTGGVTKWGGFWSSTPLVLPYGMSEPTFKDNIAQIWSVVGLQNGYKKTGVGEIGLKSAGRDGEYVVMVGDKPLPGKDGKGIIINARQIPHLVPGEVPK